MRKSIYLMVIVALVTAGLAQAEESRLGVSFDLTYTSKWLSKGTAAYGQQAGWFKTFDLDFYQTGFGVKVTHRNAGSSGYVDKQRFDYRPYFKSKLFEGQTYQTDYNLSGGYEHYPGLSRERAGTTWEWVFAFAWPNLLPVEGLTPQYIAHYEYPAGSDYTNSKVTGWVHRFALGYDFALEELNNFPLHASYEIAYSDGLGNMTHDWAYTTVGLSTTFKVSENSKLVPGIYHQTTLDSAINGQKDVTYAVVKFKIDF